MAYNLIFQPTRWFIEKIGSPENHLEFFKKQQSLKSTKRSTKHTVENSIVKASVKMEFDPGATRLVRICSPSSPIPINLLNTQTHIVMLSVIMKPPTWVWDFY